MKKIDNDTIFECPYCKKPFDIEDEDYDGIHQDHFEHVYHELGFDCPTCEGDEPAHCPAWFESAVDYAHELSKE